MPMINEASCKLQGTISGLDIADKPVINAVALSYLMAEVCIFEHAK